MGKPKFASVSELKAALDAADASYDAANDDAKILEDASNTSWSPPSARLLELHSQMSKLNIERENYYCDLGNYPVAELKAALLNHRLLVRQNRFTVQGEYRTRRWESALKHAMDQAMRRVIDVSADTEPASVASAPLAEDHSATSPLWRPRPSSRFIP